MRRDPVEVFQKTVIEKRKTDVLVNNHSEGNSPLIIQTLWNALQGTEA